MSIKIARESIGLTYPTPAEKRKIWSKIQVPSARIGEEGYRPVPEIEKVHMHPARVRHLSGAARLGKSLFMAMEAIPWAFHSNLIWLLGPDYAQTRTEFIYIVEALISIGGTESRMISLPQAKSQPCSLETNWGMTIETMTTQDPEKIASKAPDVIMLCEPGQIQDGILDRCIERLTTSRGALILAGTFEENTFTWFQDKWFKWRKWPNREDAKSFSVPMWANTYTFPEGKTDPEILRLEALLPRDQFLRRVCGIPTPSRRLILGDVWKPANSDGTPNHVGWHPFTRKILTGANPILKPVELFVDPGWGGDSYYYVGAVQWETDDQGNETYSIVDEIAVQYMTHQQVCHLAMSKIWWANVVGGVVEPWGGDNHSLASNTCIEEWREHTRLNLRAAPKLPLDERIGFLRDTLYDPVLGRSRLFFNEKSTPHIQGEASKWRRRTIRSDATKAARPSELHCDGLKGLASFLTDRMPSRTLGRRPIVREVAHVV